MRAQAVLYHSVATPLNFVPKAPLHNCPHLVNLQSVFWIEFELNMKSLTLPALVIFLGSQNALFHIQFSALLQSGNGLHFFRDNLPNPDINIFHKTATFGVFLTKT